MKKYKEDFSMDTTNQEVYLSLLLQTSSMSIALSAREAWVTHFSTTLLKIKSKIRVSKTYLKNLRTLHQSVNNNFLKETVPCKFVLAKNKNVASEFMNNLALVFRCAMF